MRTQVKNRSKCAIFLYLSCYAFKRSHRILALGWCSSCKRPDTFWSSNGNGRRVGTSVRTFGEQERSAANGCNDRVGQISLSVTVSLTIAFSLGVAYAGSRREDLKEILQPGISSGETSMEITSLTALALGLIFVGSCDGDITMSILQTMMERSEDELKEKWNRFLSLSLGLLYLGESGSLGMLTLRSRTSVFPYEGRQEANDATIETLKAIESPIGKMGQVVVDFCAYAGTGNVLKIQSMLSYCHDHLDGEKEDDLFQALAVIGVAVIAMGEEVGAEMSIRHFNHLVSKSKG